MKKYFVYDASDGSEKKFKSLPEAKEFMKKEIDRKRNHPSFEKDNYQYYQIHIYRVRDRIKNWYNRRLSRKYKPTSYKIIFWSKEQNGFIMSRKNKWTKI